MKKIPEDVQLLIDGYGNRDKIIYENDFFIVVMDPKHNDNEKFYYTAWCKEDLRSLLDIEEQHIPYINMLSNALKTEYHINDKNSRQLINFPPDYWRLHIHFVARPHITPVYHQLYFINDIINLLEMDEDYYRKHVLIAKL